MVSTLIMVRINIMRKSLILGNKSDVQKMKERLAAKQKTSEPVRKIVTFNHSCVK